MRYTIAIGKIYNYRRKTEMAKRKEAAVPAIVDSVEALEAKMQAMREAQRKFAAFTQEQVDKIFYEAAMAANKQRIPLAKMAVEETRRGIVEDKIIKNHYAAEYIYNAYKSTKTCGVIEEDPAYGIKRLPNQSAWWQPLFRRQTQPRLQFSKPSSV